MLPLPSRPQRRSQTAVRHRRVTVTAALTVLAALAVLVGLAVTPGHAPTSAAHDGHVTVPVVPSEGIQSAPVARSVPGLQSSSGKKVNIVEVLLDDARVSDLAYAPHVRRLLAGQGVSERNFFSSFPLCCPARASFYSGLLPHNHHVYSTSAPYAYRSFDDRRTIATSLSAAGYETGFVGKYLNGYGSDPALAPKLSWTARHPGATLSQAPTVESQYYVPAGWDQWYAGISGTYCRPACGGEYNYFDYGYTHNGRPRASPRGEYSSQVIGDQADHLIKRFHRVRARSGKPFFMSVNFIAPHVGSGLAPGDARCRYVTDKGRTGVLYDAAAPTWAYRAPAVAGITRGAGVLSDGTTEPGVQDKPGTFAKLPELNASQDACERVDTQRRAAAVYATDHYIGRMIATLKKSHEWHNTVFVFWSDNGYFQGEHHRMSGKIIPYEPVVRVPLIVTGPGMRGRSDRFAPMDVVDLSHTLESMAGARTPHDPDGRDMTSLLTGPDTGWNVAVPMEFAVDDPRTKGNHDRDPGFPAAAPGDVKVGVRDGIIDPRTGIGLHTGRYYYVRYADGEKELYDLWTDPNEWNNLMVQPAWVAAHQSLLASLNAIWDRTKNCVGSSCYPTLPPSLAVGRAQNTAHWRSYWRTMDAEYASHVGA